MYNVKTEIKGLVSVIIPTYNHGQYLLIALKSVFNQTYRNIEIIIIDDGSTDNTKIILNPYMDKIKYIHFQHNQGVSKARNVGIMAAKGEYIAFLDADDRWKPFKITIQLECLKKTGCALIFSDLNLIKNNKLYYKHITKFFPIFKETNINLSKIFSNKQTIWLNTTAWKGYINIYWGNIFESLFEGNFISPSTVLIKKDAIKSVGLFNEEYLCAEDTEFFLRFAKKYPIAYIDIPLTVCRKLEAGLSSQKNTELLIKNALKAQLNIIKENKSLFLQKNTCSALARTYFRLGYYYLSEYYNNLARHYFLRSLKFNFNLKSYMFFLLSFCPNSFLKEMVKLAKFLKVK